MTVGELKEVLNQFPDNETVYVWKGNWPSEHYGSDLKVSKNVYGSITCDGKTVNNPLIII